MEMKGERCEELAVAKREAHLHVERGDKEGERVIELTAPIILLSEANNVSLNEGRGPAYDAGVWLRDHWSEVLAYASDPVNLVLLGVAAVLSVAVGALFIRFGAWGLYLVRQAFDARPGVIVVGRRRMGLWDVLLHPPVWLTFAARCMHVMVVAPTRGGKTRLLLSWIEQDLRAGRTVFVLGIGGDLGEEALAIARELELPTSYVNPADPGASKWNPLASGPGNAVDRVAEQFAATLEAVSISSDPYYRAVNTTMLRRMIYASEAYAKSLGLPSDLILVKRFLEDDGYLREALEVDRDTEGCLRVELKALDEATRRWFENIYLRWNLEQRQKNTSGLYLLLDEVLGRESVADALAPGPTEPQVDLTDALSRGGLVLIEVPAAKVGLVPALLVAVMALQWFQLQMLDRARRTPICAYLDELPALLGGADTRAAESFSQFIVQVGKYGVAVHVAFQGLRMLPEGLRHVLNQNASNKFFSGRQDIEDAREIQQLLGTVEGEVEETRTTRSSAFSGPAQVSVITRTVERWRYSIDQIRKLGRGKWFFIGVEQGNLKDPAIIWVPKPGKGLLERMWGRLKGRRRRGGDS